MAGQKVSPWVRASGAALGLLVLTQLGIGFYLNAQYVPSAEGANDSVRALRESDFPRFLQNAHYWGSAWLIAHSFLHVFLLLVSGAYLRVAKWAWLGSVGLLFSAFAMQVTGNLLPFDRHDVQTAVVEGDIAAGIPLLGNFASTLMMNGSKFGPETLRAWHSAHLWLIAPLTICGLLVLFAFPADRERKPSAVRYLWIAPLAGVAILALALPAPFGSPATVLDYVETEASPSWYTLPMHVALRAFDGLSAGLGWIGAAVLPGVFAAILAAAPWLGQRRDRLVRAAFLTLVGAFGVCGVLAPASPAAISGYQEPPAADPKPDGPVAPIDESLAAKGFELAKKNCAFCHGPELNGGKGYPDLTAQFRRHRDAEYFVRFLRDPKGTKPGARMPGFAHLPEDQLAALAEWLRKAKE